MDSDSNKDERELISRRTLYLLRKQKIQKEIEAARRLIKRDIDTIEIADKFIHSTFELMKDGISKRNITLTEVEILNKIRENISINEKLKLKRKRYKNFG